MDFPLYCDHNWSYCEVCNNLLPVLCYYNYVRFPPSAASTNSSLKLNFYSILDNNYNKFYSFSRKTKNGRVMQKQEDENDPKKRGVSG